MQHWQGAVTACLNLDDMFVYYASPQHVMCCSPLTMYRTWHRLLSFTFLEHVSVIAYTHPVTQRIIAMQDVLVILPGSWSTPLLSLGPHQPLRRGPRECRLVHGHICIPAWATDAQVCCGLLSCGVHLHHWALHLLRHPHISEDHYCEERLCEGGIPFGLYELPNCYHCNSVGLFYHGEC